MDLWSDVANISFTRVGGTGYSNNATILFANYDKAETMARVPTPIILIPAARLRATLTATCGSTWTHRSNSDVSLGSHGFTRLLHEIGHALGLQHPGDYNAGPGVTITYDANAEYIEDSRSTR